METHHADTYAAICLYLTGALRLNGVQIHARVDDGELGRLPVNDDLQVAQQHIEKWLQRRWGVLLPTLMNKVKYWNPSILFFNRVDGHGDHRVPRGAPVPFPNVEDLLPYDRI